MAAAVEPLVPPKDARVRAAPFIERAVGDLRHPTGIVPPARDLRHLPGESGLIVGLKNLAGRKREGAAYVTAQARRYGPVFRSAVAHYPVVCVADAELVGAMARNEDQLWSAPLAYGTIFGGIDPDARGAQSPLSFDFDTHREVRRYLQPAFSPAAMSGYLETASEVYERAVDGWVARGQVALKPAVRRLFADVASRIFTGIDDPGEAAMLDRALADFWKSPQAVIKNPWISRTWRNGVRGLRTLNETFRARVEARRSGPDANDLFTRMCKTGGDDLPYLDDTTLVGLFVGVMGAAFDTTSLATASMGYLLAKHPAWQERLRAESKTIGRRRLTIDDARALEEHEWVWRETLRLYPVAINIPRFSLREVELRGHRIPAATFVLGLIGAVMRDATWWTDPDSFDPARFSPARAEDKRHKGAFLPFGGGPHVCIGMQLAGLEAKAFWYTLLQRCRIRLARDYEAHHEAVPLGSVSGSVELVLEPI
jgi:cytochrome P450